VSTCSAGAPSDPPDPAVDSALSESASPGLPVVRGWEHGGFKAIDTGDNNQQPYSVSFTFFTAWEDGRGPDDCEPLQVAFGPQGETWGTYAAYSIDDGWDFN
jgi:hypothetical protein